MLFDPSESWSEMFSLENTFAKFLDERGLQAEVTMPIGGGTRRVIYISKKQEIEPQVPTPPPPPIGPQEKLKDLKKGLK